MFVFRYNENSIRSFKITVVLIIPSFLTFVNKFVDFSLIYGQADEYNPQTSCNSFTKVL